jgi:hypothetical protein
VDHPPLFIPWSAFWPVQEDKFLWVKTYPTHISCLGGALRFQFNSNQLWGALPAPLKALW